MSPSTNAGSNPDGSNGSTDVNAPSRVGLTPRGERILNMVGIAVLAAFAIGWSWSIAQSNALPQQQGTAAAALRSVTTAMTQTAGPTAAYVTNAALEVLAEKSRGTSGKLQAKFALPGAVDETIKSIANFDLITLLPFSEKKNGRVGLYYIGNWPAERGGKGPRKAPPDRYANPDGFIEVTQDNRDTKVSEHFRLKDFVTHDLLNGRLAFHEKAIWMLRAIVAEDSASTGTNRAAKSTGQAISATRWRAASARRRRASVTTA